MPFTPPAEFTTRPTLEGHFGMAASTHWLATAASQAVLERGGNAFDAAVAGAFLLHVVEPHLNGPAGDMTGIFATAADLGAPQVMMGQGPAPAAATIEHYRGEGLDMVPGAGALAAAVPGAVDSWLNLLEHHGTWELAEALEFAIDYADNGHPILERAAAPSPRSANSSPSVGDIGGLWTPRGEVPEAGETVCNHAYADVLRRLIAAGEAADSREERIRAARREWKSGFVAEAIAEFIVTPHRHSTGGDHAGVMTVEDIAGFDAHFEPPVTIEFRGFEIAKIGAWGQGPVLLQALKILDGFDDERLDPSNELGGTRSSKRSSWRWLTVIPITATAMSTPRLAAQRRVRRISSEAHHGCRHHPSSGPARPGQASARRSHLRSSSKAPIAKSSSEQASVAHGAEERCEQRRHLPHRRRRPMRAT